MISVIIYHPRLYLIYRGHRASLGTGGHRNPPPPQMEFTVQLLQNQSAAVTLSRGFPLLYFWIQQVSLQLLYQLPHPILCRWRNYGQESRSVAIRNFGFELWGVVGLYCTSFFLEVRTQQLIERPFFYSEYPLLFPSALVFRIVAGFSQSAVFGSTPISHQVSGIP